MENERSKYIQPAGSPLHSFDVFMAGYRRLMMQADDLQRINEFANSHRWNSLWNYREKLLAERKTIVVTDLQQVIVYASSNIQEMTGYSAAELEGRTPKILQGPETDRTKTAHIREMIQKQSPFEADLVNYRKSGETYICRIKAFPVFNKDSALVHFIAFEEAA